ncbi:ATP-binding cassette domain-containing protein [Nocardia africana]|uniref:ATP-binding cassette domain-containing protein n=1 Tax=Nocardia africana TaxID=134964 RepID=UPI0007A45186|nr:ATP-binding cassette domain-containing protein [Nocardia africana]MCC3312595.1 ATP-binding cassette domain-containing protein [Nocardia africana]
MAFHGVEIIARGITARGARGCAFAGVSVDVAAGQLGVVAGPSGSGRTSLLLALAGRMRLVAGSVAVGGCRLPADAARVRQLVAVARAEPAVGLDDELRVGDIVTERTMIGGPRIGRAAVHDALTMLGVDAPATATVADLPPREQTLLAVALAAAEQPAAIVVDDVDRGCDDTDAERIWEALRILTGLGCTVVATTTIPPPSLDDSVAVIDLPHPTQRDQIPLPEE